jgi:hypothetical protein
MLPWLQPFKKMQSRDKKFLKIRMICQQGRKAAKSIKYILRNGKSQFFFFHADFLPVAFLMLTFLSDF